MRQTTRSGWVVLVVANVLLCCMLGFYQTSGAAPGGGTEPFSNSVQQRGEIIQQLKEVAALLKEQNKLLASGKLTVIVEKGKP